MNWADYIKRLVVRRVVWVLVGVGVYLLLAVVGVARAQSSYYATIGEAYSAASSFAAALGPRPGVCQAIAPNPDNIRIEHDRPNTAFWVRWVCVKPDGTSYPASGNARFTYAHGCDPDSPWRDDLNLCFDPSECSARNQQPGFGVPTTRPWREFCSAGCELKMTGSEGVRCTTVNGQMLCSGSLEWSGNSCSVPPGAPPQEDEPPTRPDQSSCVPSADGQTFCLKPSGEACYSHANGRQTCWMPTETGTKPDGSNLQKRDAGTEAIPPANPNLPTGDTLEKSGESVNTTTTVSGAGGSTTINTTTTNYVTQHGTSAAPGQADQGEAGDGSGGGAEGGDGDEDKGSIEGGGDCEAPPVARGGDPIMVAVVDQAWATRCAVEAGNAAKVTGDVGDCKSDFSVEGTNANAEQLRAMRVAICGAEKRAEESKAENKEVADGTASELAGYESQLADAEARGIFGTGSGAPGTGINPGWLSFGGGSCPVISFEFPGVGTWEPPPAFCDLILALSLLFQLIAMVWALQIIGS